jgi:hypothetical protein
MEDKSLLVEFDDGRPWMPPSGRLSAKTSGFQEGNRTMFSTALAE